MRSPQLRACLLLAVLTTMAWPAAAAADDELHVVVLGFRGPGRVADRCEDAVVRVVQVEHQLVPRADYTRARRRLRPSGGATAFAAVAAAIGADAVVTGSVDRDGRRRVLSVTVRDGVTGEVVDTIRVRLRGTALDRKTRRQLRTELTKILGWVAPRPSVVEDDLEDPLASDDEADQSDDQDDEDDEDDEDDDAANQDDEECSGDQCERETAHRGAADSNRGFSGHANLGIAMVGRDLRFTVQSSVAASDQPMAYQGAPVGSARLSAELYPLIRRRGHLARLGLALDIERALRMHSSIMVDGVARDLDTSQSRWGVGVRYRLPVGGSAVKLAAGYDHLSHQINRAGLDLDLPNVSYSYFDVGAGVEIGFSGGEWLLCADGRYLHVVDAGEIAQPSAYGGGTVAGYHIDTAMARTLNSGVVVRAGVEYLRMAFAFDGSGAMTDVDSDPDQDVGGAADTWFGGYVTAGIAF